MKKWSVAEKNIVILVLSLLPFIIGLSFSISKSADREYFSSAINIAGSQRMRTMLISNYSQQLYYAAISNKKQDVNEIKDVLVSEIDIYQHYFDALRDGNPDLKIKPNKFEDIGEEMETLNEEVDAYIKNAQMLILHPDDYSSLKIIVENAMGIKDGFHRITELYQIYNDQYIEKQRRLDLAMIVLAAGITIVGLLLTSRIRQQEYHANNDFLTKLKNRHSLFEYIKDKSSTDYTVFFIDLNKFKVINDTYGHETGDEILIAVSNILRNVFGSETLYRYGGDEFVALSRMDTCDLEGSQCGELINSYINQIKQRLSAPIVDRLGRKHSVGLALGAVSKEVGIEDWKTLINLADDLMYDSKSISSHVMVCRSKSELETRLRFMDNVDVIFSKGLIKLHYEPIYSIDDDSIEMFNILSRWDNDGKEFCATEFLPILKRKGYLTELDRHTLKILEQDHIKRTKKRSDEEIRYAITLAEDTLLNLNTNGMLQILETLEIPKSKIVIKIREELLSSPRIQEVVSRVKELGFSLAVDNFTIDLSLRESEKYKNIEVVKIGNTLVRSLVAQNHTLRVLVEFVNMLVSDGKTVVLEGLHKNEGFDTLRDANKNAQGKVLYAKSNDLDS